MSLAAGDIAIRRGNRGVRGAARRAQRCAAASASARRPERAARALELAQYPVSFVMPMWCVSNDPCGICCAVASAFLLFFADYVVVFSVLHPWFGAEGKFFPPFASSGISLLAVCSHLRAMLTDPGAVPLSTSPATCWSSRARCRCPRGATASSRRARTTARSATGASSRWTTTARG